MVVNPKGGENLSVLYIVKHSSHADTGDPRVRLSITDYNLASSQQSAPQNHFILHDILKPLSSGFMQMAKISQLKHCI